jgi:hypothetical protein
MKSHELARILLENENLDIATHANNHTFADQSYVYEGKTFRDITVGVLKHYSGNFIIIGNMREKALNPPNWFITKMITADLPEKE